MKSIAIVLAFAVGAHASSGDRDGAFQSCVSHKISEHCRAPAPLPFMLQLTRWTCEDDCKYQCTHIMTDNASSKGRRPEQFYGKWAFRRVLGMQEPASVAFSLMNLWAHVKGGINLHKRIKKNHPMRRYYLVFTAVSLNSWIWSAIFHIRDKPWTEKMDYFSAGSAIMYGLFYSVVRLYHLYFKPQAFIHGPSSRHRLLVPWGGLCLALFLGHTSYLTLTSHFDYGWNMKANIAVGFLHNLLWMSYVLASPPYQRFRSLPNSYRPTYVLEPAIIGTAIIIASALEVFDFPPWWRFIDAHSLWHLSTVPIIVAWYRFLINDSLDVAWKQGLL